jgi:ribonuclease BN (tRNA processing enzyme)
MPELVILGSGTGIPSLRRGSPSLALVSENAKILIDTGAGALRKMLEAGLTYLNIDVLLYTHIHPDHIADLVPLLFASKYGEEPRRKELRCLGGPGFYDYFLQLEKLYGRWTQSQTYRLVADELLDGPLFFRNFKISSKSMAHMDESVGYRIEVEGGKTVAVSGDTDYCDNLIELAKDVDLLVLECSFPDGKKVEGHLTPSLAAKVASESRCKELLLTHLYPICDQFDILAQCREAFGGEVLLAEDLMRIAL